jgi:hypothetical protein
VGSTLWKKGHDIAREIALIKSLADEGYWSGFGKTRIDPGEPG